MVIVAGGGSTGLGVAWDLALRGIPVTLLEAGQLTEGTSGRFHGLLHSGGRYLVTDAAVGRECYEENALLKRLVPEAIEDTGGYFVRFENDDADFEKRWLEAAERVGMPARPVVPRDLLKRVPSLRRDVASAYLVPDGGIDSFRLERSLVEGIVTHGGTVLTGRRVLGPVESDGILQGVRVQGRDGEEVLPCDAFVNACGPWAGQVAAAFGLGIRMHLARGTMIIFANRQVPACINHLARPGDGDILVPHDRVAIFGTTDVRQEEPEAPAPPPEEIQHLMELGRRMFPAIDEWRVLRAFAGVRPLYDPAAEGREGRQTSRSYSVLDHGREGGVVGAFSIVGGKLTTFRLMAERAADAVCSYIGEDRPSRTREVPLPAGRQASVPLQGAGSARVLCECEGVTDAAFRRGHGAPLGRRRVDTWFAMGPCQGTFCGHRAAAVRAEEAGLEVARHELCQLRAERLRGFGPVAWGDNARELLLQRHVLAESLAEELPEGNP